MKGKDGTGFEVREPKKRGTPMNPRAPFEKILPVFS
jgi:hypothetical protein